MAGAVRSGVGALVSAAQSPVPTMAVLADIRTGRPGSADERDGGDGAAAFVFGGDADLPVLAEVIGQASVTAEFLDRWRAPGAAASRVWEERFGEQVYAPLAEAALADALKQAALTPGQVDHLIVAGLPARAVRRASRSAGSAGRGDRRQTARTASATRAPRSPASCWPTSWTGRTRTRPWCCWSWPTAPRHSCCAPPRPWPATGSRGRSPQQIAAGSRALDYATFLSWRGFLDREPPRRPDPEPVAAPPAQRRADWKFGLVAAKCTRCGTRSLPPGRVCQSCHAVDEMTAEPLADVPATVTTYTVDRLAYTPSPPVLMVVLDFDGGGRMRCQLTDAAEDEARIGLRVEMTFRRLVTAAGVHNYFWKARPLRAAAGEQAGQSSQTGQPSTDQPSTDRAARRGRVRDGTWGHTESGTRSPSWGWAAPSSASTGTGPPTTCWSRRRRRPPRQQAWNSATSTPSGSGTMGSGVSGLTLSPAAAAALQAGHQAGEHVRHRV